MEAILPEYLNVALQNSSPQGTLEA